MTRISETHLPPQPSNAVQILGMILFAAFAIPVTIVALNIFWPAGIALAMVLGWRGTFAFPGRPEMDPQQIKDIVQAVVPDRAPVESGNASFDAYRNDMLDRLEMEQENFEAFVGRLRDARDKAEFDSFMDDRMRLQGLNKA